MNKKDSIIFNVGTDKNSGNAISKVTTEWRKKAKGVQRIFIVSVACHSFANNLNIKVSGDDVINLNNDFDAYVNTLTETNEIDNISLYEKDASMSSVLNSFQTLSKKITNQDNLILHFSGHMIVNEVKRVFPVWDWNGNTQNLESKSIDGSLVVDYLSSINFKNAITVFDCKHHVYDKTDNIIKPIVHDWNTHYVPIENPISTNPEPDSFLVNKYIGSGFQREVVCFYKQPVNQIEPPLDRSTTIIAESRSINYNSIKREIIKKDIFSAIEMLKALIEGKDIGLYEEVIALGSYLSFVENQKNLQSNSKQLYEQYEQHISEGYRLADKILEAAKAKGIAVVPVPDKSFLRRFPEDQKVKILFVDSNNKTNNTGLAREIREVENILLSSQYRDRFELKKLTATTIKDLQAALLNFEPHFVHFCGDGSEKGIFLYGTKGKVIEIEPGSLGGLFEYFNDVVACVILNLCNSIDYCDHLKDKISKVIGMKGKISEELAIEFSTAFYLSIASNRSIEFAYKFAVNSLTLNQIPGSSQLVIL